MKVLSLFNGISGCHLALDKAGIQVDQVYYSEIDKYANQVTQHHYPNDIALGDVTKWQEWDIDWSEIGLVGAGFPCQAWSVAGKQLGDKDERGMLFWTTLEIIAHVLKHNPKAKFLMENVKMKKEFEEYITHHTEQALGHVEKTLINSALVSAQNRQRYYWTNFEVTQPEDKGILLKDVLDGKINPEFYYSENSIAYMERGNEKWMQAGSRRADRYKQRSSDPKSFTLTANMHKGVPYNYFECANGFRPASIVGRRLNERGVRDDYNKSVPITQCLQVKHSAKKTGCLTTVDKDNVLSTEPPGRYPDIYNRGDISYRKLTPLECERLQTVPDNFTSMLSNTQRYKCLGNGWTIDVIAHIFKCAFEENHGN